MNKVELIGRLTRNPDVRYSTAQDGAQTCVARYTLAVDRRMKQQNGQQTADFISCVAFGKAGEFAEKYLSQGTKIAIVGRIQTGSYTDKDGRKVYTTDVVVEDHEFVESKGQQQGAGQPQQQGQQNGAGQPRSNPAGTSQQQAGGYYPQNGGYYQQQPQPVPDGFIPPNMPTDLPYV